MISKKPQNLNKQDTPRISATTFAKTFPEDSHINGIRMCFIPDDMVGFLNCNAESVRRDQILKHQKENERTICFLKKIKRNATPDVIDLCDTMIQWRMLEDKQCQKDLEEQPCNTRRACLVCIHNHYLLRAIQDRLPSFTRSHCWTDHHLKEFRPPRKEEECKSVRKEVDEKLDQSLSVIRQYIVAKIAEDAQSNKENIPPSIDFNEPLGFLTPAKKSIPKEQEAPLKLSARKCPHDSWPCIFCDGGFASPFAAANTDSISKYLRLDTPNKIPDDFWDLELMTPPKIQRTKALAYPDVIEIESEGDDIIFTTKNEML